MDKLNKYSADWSGFIFQYLRRRRLQIYSYWCTFITRSLLSLKGIGFGHGQKFYGLPSFHRFPLSSITIGDQCRFRSDSLSNLVGVNRKCIVATLKKGARIQIGHRCGLSGAVIGAAMDIELGNNVLVGANTLITDYDWHNINPLKRTTEVKGAKPVKIGNNVWLGINTVVLKGVNIGDNTVIGANSIVVKDIPANVIAAGNPCRVIKPIDKEIVV